MLTLLANSTLPDLMLLEDANDICEFLEASGRTIPRERWALEIARAISDDSHEGDF